MVYYRLRFNQIHDSNNWKCLINEKINQNESFSTNFFTNHYNLCGNGKNITLKVLTPLIVIPFLISSVTVWFFPSLEMIFFGFYGLVIFGCILSGGWIYIYMPKIYCVYHIDTEVKVASKGFFILMLAFRMLK